MDRERKKKGRVEYTMPGWFEDRWEIELLSRCLCVFGDVSECVFLCFVWLLVRGVGEFSAGC